MPPERWAIALYSQLPPDLVVKKSSQVPDNFSSRFHVLDRHYRYRIGMVPRDPLVARYRYDHGRPLDVASMQEAASYLQGDHDFRAFTEELEPHILNTRRELFKVNVRSVRDEVWVDVVGTAFLRGMMRRMSGALLEVGRGRRPIEEVSRLLDPEERDSIQWPVVLPAHGLCLMQVRYGRHPRDNRSP
jgi:tRNA pseudouridine38-40 synthase